MLYLISNGLFSSIICEPEKPIKLGLWLNAESGTIIWLLLFGNKICLILICCTDKQFSCLQKLKSTIPSGVESIFEEVETFKILKLETDGLWYHGLPYTAKYEAIYRNSCSLAKDLHFSKNNLIHSLYLNIFLILKIQYLYYL